MVGRTSIMQGRLQAMGVKKLRRYHAALIVENLIAISCL
jgi:hypothetical protein